MAGLKICPILQKARIVTTVLTVVLVSLPVLAQDTNARREGAQTNPQPANSVQQAAPQNAPQSDVPARPASTPDAGALHQPPDESLFAPVSAVADALGISALLSALGLEGQVASAVGGILLIGLLIAIIFLIWWRLMGRYRIAGRRRNEVRRR